MAMNGTSVLVLAQTGTDGTTGDPIYTAVGEQTNLSTESTTNMIAADSKDSGHTKWLPGKQDDTASLEALYVPSDTAYKAIETAKKNGELIYLRRSEDGVNVEEAPAYVQSISKNFPDNDNSTVTLSFQLNDFWTALP